ncbi:hypothetical protein ACP3V3_02925 [Vibrio sp. PNB22_3_1]
MKAKKLILPLICVSALTACTEPYDFTGRYVATLGEDCQPDHDNNHLIIISPYASGDNSYTAQLNNALAFGGIIPIHSEPSSIADDGSLTLTFYKQGKTGLILTKPTVDMQLKLVSKDKSHVYIQNWPVIISMPSSNAPGDTFDFVKDREVVILGRKIENELRKMAGESGFCLKRTSS